MDAEELLRRAKDLIDHFDWTGAERSDVIADADRWLEDYKTYLRKEPENEVRRK